MNVATSLNKKYVAYTGVMLYSLGMNNQEHIDVYLLNSELDIEDIERLRECVAEFDMNIIDLKVDRTMFPDKLPRTQEWSLETYFRLMLLDLLPNSVKRILYLDVDVIVDKSLRSLYEVDFGEDEVIACVDSCGMDYTKIMKSKQMEMFGDAFENGYQYFNAGVMMLNIEKMRGKYNFEYYLMVMEKDWNYEMDAPDQDILNYVHGPNVAYVDWGIYDLFAHLAHLYGITYHDVKQGAAIIHFAGPKPWETKNYHYDIEKIWWEYAKQTTFYVELLERFTWQTIEDQEVELLMDSLKIDCKRLLEMNQKLLQ